MKKSIQQRAYDQILREGDASPDAEVARKHKLSGQTIYIWRKCFGALQANDVSLKQLEQDCARLKRLLAERDPEVEGDCLGGKARRTHSPTGRDPWRSRGPSQRRACAVLHTPRCFRSRVEAKAVIETWRLHYGGVRPHSCLDYLTPNEFTAKLTGTNHLAANCPKKPGRSTVGIILVKLRLSDNGRLRGNRFRWDGNRGFGEVSTSGTKNSCDQ